MIDEKPILENIAILETENAAMLHRVTNSIVERESAEIRTACILNAAHVIEKNREVLNTLREILDLAEQTNQPTPTAVDLLLAENDTD